MAGALAVNLDHEDEAQRLDRADRALERPWVPSDGEADIIELDYMQEK